MKILAYYPTNGTNITVEISAKEEQRLYGKKIGEQFDGVVISEQFAGCIVQIVGGNDYQGVCMVPNRDTTKSIRLLLSKGDVGYRAKQAHIRKRKTVRGSIISNSIQVISIILVRLPEGKVIEGLTDVVKDKSHLPKKASKLRALFGIPEGEDIVSFVAKAVKANDPDAKVPKLKVTGIITEEMKKKRAEKLVFRRERTEKFNKEKAEYEAKYGVAV